MMVLRGTLLVLWWSGMVGCISAKMDTGQGPFRVETAPDDLYRAIRQELIGRAFQLDEVNRRRGVVTTQALVSKQWFEFWRQDVVSLEAGAEASLQTIRRRVKVTVIQANSRHYELDCQVQVERRVSDLQRARNHIRAQDVFYRTGGPVPSLAMRQEESGPRWQVIDRDEPLETAILAGISAKLKRHN